MLISFFLTINYAEQLLIFKFIEVQKIFTLTNINNGTPIIYTYLTSLLIL